MLDGHILQMLHILAQMYIQKMNTENAEELWLKMVNHAQKWKQKMLVINMRDKIIQCTIVNGTKNNDINGKNSDLIQSFLLFINIGDWKLIVTESIPSLIEVDYCFFRVY